jgi:cell division protease FtsH
MSDPKKPNNNDNKQPRNRFPLWIVMIGVMLLLLWMNNSGASNAQDISYTEFLAAVETGRINSVVIYDRVRLEGRFDPEINREVYDQNYFLELDKRSNQTWYGPRVNTQPGPRMQQTQSDPLLDQYLELKMRQWSGGVLSEEQNELLATYERNLGLNVPLGQPGAEPFPSLLRFEQARGRLLQSLWQGGDETAYQGLQDLHSLLERNIALAKISSDNINWNTEIAYTALVPDYVENLSETLMQQGAKVRGDTQNNGILDFILNFLPFILIIVAIGYFFFMFRRMQDPGGKAMGFGKSKAKKLEPSSKKVTFKDVAGQKEAKYELEEVVQFLKDPEKFSAIGAKIPKGVLLVGMPGTGKTLMAKAVAGEAGVNFFHMSGSDFVEMFVGVGASRVRDLFDQGRKNAPCILFIDEIDAVGRTRGAGYGGGHDEREQTLNQMLVEMDGFDTKEGVIVIAATNRADVLDPALLRAGRFDRQVTVAMPDVEERHAILKIHAAKVRLAGDVELKRIARGTPGSSGADLANIVNEAALLAARKGQKMVRMEDFEEAKDKIQIGLARVSNTRTDEDNRLVAIHEAGHALLHYYTKGSDPLNKVTIIPRGGAGGLTFSLPENDKVVYKKEYLEAQMVTALGGLVAEEIIYGEHSSGVSNDLKQITRIARLMVTKFGMSDKLGSVSYGSEDEPIFIGREIAQHKDYSSETAEIIDNEVRRIVDKAKEFAMETLRTHQDQLEKLANTLIERETLDDDQVRELLGFPPRDPDTASDKTAVTEDPGAKATET